MSITGSGRGRKSADDADVFVWLPESPALPAIAVVTGERGETTRYYLTEDLGADPSFGRCFAVDKFATCEGTDAEERQYQVSLNGRESACTCRGFLRWRVRCRHIKACEMVVESPHGTEVAPFTEEP